MADHLTPEQESDAALRRLEAQYGSLQRVVIRLLGYIAADQDDAEAFLELFAAAGDAYRERRPGIGPIQEAQAEVAWRENDWVVQAARAIATERVAETGRSTPPPQHGSGPG
jgi:hypothetical protein